MLRGGLQHRSFGIFCKILCLTVFAFLIPKLFLRNLKKQNRNKSVFQFGIETITTASLQQFCPVESNIGLLISEGNYTQDGQHVIPFLTNKGFCLSKVFFTNKLEKNDYPVDCMAWKNKQNKDLEDIDIFFVDIFDYQNNEIKILIELLDFSLLHNKKVIIFDRPNLSGNMVQGPFQRFTINDKACAIPYFHGMTTAELALYCNNYILPKPATLHIIPMNAYKRSEHSFYKKFEMAQLVEISCLITKKTTSQKELQQLQSFFSKAITVFLYRPIPQLID